MGSNPTVGFKDQSALSAFTRAQRAFTALRALALRSSGVILAARAGPPFIPPLRPRATAAGFLRLLATSEVYVSGYVSVNIILLTIRERSRIIDI